MGRARLALARGGAQSGVDHASSLPSICTWRACQNVRSSFQIIQFCFRGTGQNGGVAMNINEEKELHSKEEAFVLLEIKWS